LKWSIVPQNFLLTDLDSLKKLCLGSGEGLVSINNKRLFINLNKELAVLLLDPIQHEWVELFDADLLAMVEEYFADVTAIFDTFTDAIIGKTAR